MMAGFESYRFLKLFFQLLLFHLFCFLGVNCMAQNGDYKALFAKQAPKIDGDTSDAVWSNISTWSTYNQVWLNNVGSTPTPEDFSWKFKLAWTEDRFYILAVITDDVISDRYASPLDRYYEDDTFEVFFDEDNSGGDHQRSFQAFAYHVSLKYDIVDSDNTGAARLLNDHAEVRMDTVDGKYVWEAAFKVYDKTFTINNPGQPVKLFAGKKMGWGLAYCDNDGRAQRDHFFGSEYVEGTNKNVAYINADVFGDVELVNPSVPKFSHITVDNGLVKPTAMRIAPNGDIYVCEQTGALKVLRNGELQSASLVTVKANTDGPSNTERGLLGLALDPGFATNNYIYLYYTSAERYVHNRISRFTLNGNNNVTNTEVVLSELDSLSEAAIHNGGAMHFGLDGKLYIATGENATPSNSQNLGSTHGKLLRLNRDGTVPTDNPFYGVQGADPRIWSYGLRNPFTFDISASGQILLNDVGFETMEEIDDATEAGQNYGWPLEEGLVPNAKFKKPLYTYKRVTAAGNTDSTGCAITGGVFFEPRSTNYPQEYVGKYFFMDYCSQWINCIDPKDGSGRKTFATNVARYPIAIDIHPDGNLYYLTRSNGSIYKIAYSGEPLPIITRQPEVVTVTVGEALDIMITASGAEPMVYEWKKNGIIISSEKDNQFVIAKTQFSDSGTYTVKVTNAYGVGQTKPIKVLVLEPNTPPIASIEPISDVTFSGGQTYKIIGKALDPEDGTLSGTALTWSVDLYHANHVHDGLPTSGKEVMEFTIPVAGGHTETDIFYRITLIAKDTRGATDTAFVDLFPEILDISINSEPSGLQFTLEGTPYSAPFTFKTVRGVRRRLGAFGPQYLNGGTFQFDNWEHSTDSVNFIEPTEAGIYTIRYKNALQTGLEHFQNELGVIVYPNPFSESITMDVKGSGKLMVMDMLGNIMKVATVQEGKNDLELDLKSGIYHLIYQVGEMQHHTKIIRK